MTARLQPVDYDHPDLLHTASCQWVEHPVDEWRKYQVEVDVDHVGIRYWVSHDSEEHFMLIEKETVGELISLLQEAEHKLHQLSRLELE